jgi:hypothetical protein
MLLGLFKRRRDYLDWEAYQRRIGFIELFAFQQRARKRNIKNLLVKE